MPFSTLVRAPNAAVEALATRTEAVEYLRDSVLEARKADFRLFLCLFLAPVVVVALFLTLWPSRTQEQDCHNCPHYDNPEFECEYEDWVSHSSDSEDDASIRANAYNSVKRVPLSRDEVSRLIDTMRADSYSPQTTWGLKREASNELSMFTDLAANNAQATCGLKRKASDASEAATGSSSESPRSRKLKIVTDFGVEGKWVNEEPKVFKVANSEDSPSGSSTDLVAPFTFRASLPGREIRRCRAYTK
ncbi:MAG: hypothetical protein Q9222_004491 [Ikaeria aurantiellina]